MTILSNVILFLALAAAIVFSLLVLLTGKGDAMSGGGSVRTSYKGKATFDDMMSKSALFLGIFFMGMVLVYTVITKRMTTASLKPSPSKSSAVKAPDANPPASNNAPSSAPAANNAPVNTPPANNAPVTPPAANNTPSANNSPSK